MSEEIKEQAGKILAGITDPYIRANVMEAGLVRSIDDKGNGLSVTVRLGYPAGEWMEQLQREIESALKEIGQDNVTVDIGMDIQTHAVQTGVTPIKGVKNIIAVASGKGGVGKSTTAVNLALALSVDGARVGILDADIYGPSQPRMLGCHGKPEVTPDKTILPMTGHGIQNMSIGYMVDEETPMIWRGPMVTSALQQLTTETQWDALDYLVIDLPPGTGDIQLTLAQKIPVSGAVIVTTPQDIALLDARKALKMFEKLKITTLGIVENMSTHICSHCGHEEALFGSGGGVRISEQHQIPLLGQLPLEADIGKGADNGRPTVAVEPDSPTGLCYREMARRTAAMLSQRAKDYSSHFPKIVVEKKNAN